MLETRQERLETRPPEGCNGGSSLTSTAGSSPSNGGLSCNVIGSTKLTRSRRLTLGATTVATVEEHVRSCRQRDSEAATGDWQLATDPTRHTHLTADRLSHRFGRIGAAAGVRGAALHRLRHAVATTLVCEGKLLQAQARLGHRDSAMTLRHYAHALPLDGQDVADELDLLRTQPVPSENIDSDDPTTNRGRPPT